jgi:hypothetical protein
MKRWNRNKEKKKGRGLKTEVTINERKGGRDRRNKRGKKTKAERKDRKKNYL